MLDVLKTLSGLVKPKHQQSVVSAPVAQKPVAASKPSKKAKAQLDVDLDAQRKLAEAQVREIILEAKDEALRIRR